MIRAYTLSPGDYFGEKALVEKTPRTATVIAHGPVKCAALSIAGFERLMVSKGLGMERREKGKGQRQETREKSPRGPASISPADWRLSWGSRRVAAISILIGGVHLFPRKCYYYNVAKSPNSARLQSLVGPVRRHAHNGVQQPCRRQDREAVTQGWCLGFQE